MEGKCFISYRRDDAGWGAGRICDALSQELRDNVIFLDTKSLTLGLTFKNQIIEALSECRVLLAIIGENWLNTQDDHGRRRIDNNNDYVRFEISTALTRAIPVVPVLLDAARAPERDKLPDDLKELISWQAWRVRQQTFRLDLQGLIDYLRATLSITTASKRIEALSALFNTLKLPSSLNVQGISRAIDPSLASVLWSRLQTGERGFLQRAVYNEIGRFLFDEIRHRCDTEPDFHDCIENFVSRFEAELEESRQARLPPEEIIALQSSALGRVYLLLAHSIRRIG